MAQSDQVVQNATFPAVRADINDNLAALFSQSEGGSAPAVTRAFQPWVDTSSNPPIWKVRNSSNSAWITVGVLDPAAFQVGGITPIANGGTGTTTAAAALTAFLPSQSGNTGKALVTNGTVASWSPVATSSVTVFTSSGTWTKPSSGTAAKIYLWGGGGSGGRSTAGGGGGGGGACVVAEYRLADLPSTVSVTIGAGGSVTAGTTTVNGAVGANSVFGSLFTAYGGGGGVGGGSSDGGGGGGWRSAGTFLTGGSGYDATSRGGFGAEPSSSTEASSSTYGGGGAGGASGVTLEAAGATSQYGGGGGGGHNGGAVLGVGGLSLFGGKGGTAQAVGLAGQAGTFPAGGGSGCDQGGNSVSPGAGGNGYCIVIVY
jgi:hypothetical protein